MSQYRSQYTLHAKQNPRRENVVLLKRKPSTTFLKRSEGRYISSYKEEKRAFLVIRLDPMSALTNPPHTTFQLRQFVNDVQRPQDQAHIVAPGQDVFEDTTSEVTDVLRANPEKAGL
jgi:hypothetical protein